jgi:hypothetical protein
MAELFKQRMRAKIDGDFVVFILGMRINKLWKVHKWFPIAMSMPKMLKELIAKPELGLLGIQSIGGIPPVTIQYWRSFEHLEAYARDKNAAHLPAWKNFNMLISGNSDVGIWHETYLIKDGNYENIYNNMPRYGMGKSGELLPVSKKFEGAGERLRDKMKKD